MVYVLIILMCILLAGFVVLLVISILHLKNYKNLTRYLGNHYPRQWRELGEPGLSNTSPRNVMKLLKFLAASFENQGDLDLEYLIRRTRKTLNTGIVVFSGEFFLFLIVFILIGIIK